MRREYEVSNGCFASDAFDRSANRGYSAIEELLVCSSSSLAHWKESVNIQDFDGKRAISGGAPHKYTQTRSDPMVKWNLHRQTDHHDRKKRKYHYVHKNEKKDARVHLSSAVLGYRYVRTWVSSWISYTYPPIPISLLKETAGSCIHFPPSTSSLASSNSQSQSNRTHKSI